MSLFVNKKYLSHIHRKHRSILSAMDTSMYMSVRRLQEECADKGVLQSGLYQTSLFKLITEAVTSALGEAIQHIDDVQTEYNRKLTGKEYLRIRKDLEEQFVSSVDSLSRRAVNDWQATVDNMSNDVAIKCLRGNVINDVHNGLTAIREKYELMNLDNGAKEARRANYIAICSLVASLVSIGISVILYLLSKFPSA